MKVWKAELILRCTDEDKWETKFIFESDGEEYKFNEESNLWSYQEGYACNLIPINMCVSYTYGGNLKVQQGFDGELTKEELNDLEIDMKYLLLKELKSEKERYLETYREKVKSIRGDGYEI